MSRVLAHHVDPWIGRQVRSGGVTGPSCEIGGYPPVRHSAGSQVIADLPIGARGGLRHHSATANAHLHRPWRATSEYAIGAEIRRSCTPQSEGGTVGENRPSPIVYALA